MLNIFKRLIKEEEGQGMVEYGLILALVALAAVLALTGLGTAIKDKFTEIVTKLDGTVPTE
ncbi:Flp family type IVb pilin [Clostridium sp. Cult2]|uniref:Flp family type IVb pilin n=1 Tax=Clostridium sp. Cult2 TaxID=2079003 RepID=UPI001F352301|nr:Flp family type IVb pilin [Clostridium sp. Cult2]MCF6466666.1 Flp family type IVb pilin [Clostridium sp. Cult2]